jgi:hypothetical protein
MVMVMVMVMVSRCGAQYLCSAQSIAVVNTTQCVRKLPAVSWSVDMWTRARETCGAWPQHQHLLVATPVMVAALQNTWQYDGLVLTNAIRPPNSLTWGWFWPNGSMETISGSEVFPGPPTTLGLALNVTSGMFIPVSRTQSSTSLFTPVCHGSVATPCPRGFTSTQPLNNDVIRCVKVFTANLTTSGDQARALCEGLTDTKGGFPSDIVVDPKPGVYVLASVTDTSSSPPFLATVPMWLWRSGKVVLVNAGGGVGANASIPAAPVCKYKPVFRSLVDGIGALRALDGSLVCGHGIGLAQALVACADMGFYRSTSFRVVTMGPTSPRTRVRADCVGFELSLYRCRNVTVTPKVSCPTAVMLNCSRKA